MRIKHDWKRFWRLLVIWDWKDKVYWKRKFRTLLCKCDCWKLKEIIFSNVKRGNTKSCGCLRKEATSQKFTTHGMRWTRIHTIRGLMKQRCNNNKDIAYKYYWGRWITYDLKREKFENFYEDMKDAYREGLTVDRVDNNWNYCKGNCRRATRKEQSNNKRTNRLIVYKWQKKTLQQWSENTWIKRWTISRRLKMWRNKDRVFSNPI